MTGSDFPLENVNNPSDAKLAVALGFSADLICARGTLLVSVM